MTLFALPTRPGDLRLLATCLLDETRSRRLLPHTALLVLARALGVKSEVEEAAWRRTRASRRAGFFDALIAELILRGMDLSLFPGELRANLRAHRALLPAELAGLLSTLAAGSKRGLGHILSCDRATIRRHLKTHDSVGDAVVGKAVG